MIRLLLLCVLTPCLFCFEPLVTLKLGSVRGLQEQILGKNVNYFLGIPYAKPPVNELRFRRPQPFTEKWSTDFDAQIWPNVCPQPQLFGNISNQSEDCLYLNVWTPVDLESDFSSNLKPVMVYIHGGAFYLGSSAMFGYNSSVLSSVGDVVVVTVNYRLGALGFLYGGNEEMPGNMGLYDQALALEWIQDNIAYFGGDKNLVTVFGLSAGAMSTVYHTMSPVSRSLFKYAIAMSGVAIENFLTDSAETATTVRNHVSKLLGCGNGDEQTISESTLNCLKKVETERFISSEMYALSDIRPDLLLSWFVPVFGQEFIPKDLQLMWKEKQFKRDCNLLIGTVPHESTVSAVLNTSVFNTENWKVQLKNHLDYYGSPKYAIDVNEIEKFYFSGVSGNNEKDIYFRVLDDFYFNCPTNMFAEKYSEVNTVYQYLLDFEPKKEFMPYKLQHLGHGNDMPFIFGATENDSDFEISLEWIKIITDFAKTGKARWPPYSRTKDGKLIPYYYEMKGNEHESEVDVGLRFFECRVWRQFLFKGL